jgi:hypothetical protein
VFCFSWSRGVAPCYVVRLESITRRGHHDGRLVDAAAFLAAVRRLRAARGSENPMSDTDSHRPEWVRCNDHRRDVEEVHYCRRGRFGRGDCDLPPWPVSKHDLDARCHYSPTGELWRRIYGGSYVSPRSRRPFRRQWFSTERTAQRAILRSLTRDANSGGEIDEEVIDHRQTHRHATYGGGYWD